MAASRHTIEIKNSSGTVVFELEKTGRTFKVLRAVMDNRPELVVGFDPKSADEVLDQDSDAQQVFGIAMRVKVLGCTLGVSEMRAPDVETLTLALKKVKFRAWSPEEI